MSRDKSASTPPYKKAAQNMLKVKNLTKLYATDRETVPAVRNCSFEVEQGEFYTLLGPSGCGKSTILRCIAGLEKPNGGEIWIDGAHVLNRAHNVDVPPNHRHVGLVFQSYAIWPHMTVFGNVAFPITHGYHALPKRQVRDRVMEVLRLVRLEDLADRPAMLLSGGQQQRVALARALVHQPKLLLLDEPLSNLDAKLREEMRHDLKDLMSQLRLTTLYVTHDQLEALSMSDRVAIINNGDIIEEGTPEEIYNHPKDLFTAQFVGRVNILEGRFISQDCNGDMGIVRTSLGELKCPLPDRALPGDEIVVTIRPENLRISSVPDRAGCPNALEGQLERTTFLGGFWESYVNVQGHLLKAVSRESSDLGAGSRVCLCVSPEHCKVFPKPAAPR